MESDWSIAPSSLKSAVSTQASVPPLNWYARRARTSPIASSPSWTVSPRTNSGRISSSPESAKSTGEVRVDNRLIDYVNKIVRLTRQWPQFHMGASPRAGLGLLQGARTLAAFRGRDYAVPDDVVEIALPALRHRVILTAEAEVEGHDVDHLLTELIRTVEVPRL